ncbi:hypothetical protein BAY61_01330 [Prauserella marina]|uniref:Uncharacterized protein n=1 Tax=Prauserella marina TaxID=530584 RepID=A0A222VJG7_9PSEU|nr:hypothetical protein [Prauserella marina]ASR33851.1 hypothetical protein BAY61_01330 [Prauserella marina]PWV82439.1 hypothetical protein DES30_102682 [Prauserella marina]SDC69257.1 hypothetical protein SAMN05421630_103218 [Prauserella marina]
MAGDKGKDQTFASTAAVAGLAREVEGLRKAVEPVTALSNQIDELARVVQYLAARQAGPGPAAGCTPSWLDMPTEPAATREALEELAWWMRLVFLRYADAAQNLPECWLWHPDIVEELLWLMHAWLAAYRDEKATVARAGDWHDRYRPGVVRRIKTLGGNCSLENHQQRGNHTGSPVVPLTEAMAPISAWWATHREQAAPEPEDEHYAAAATVQRRAGGGRR